MLTLYDVPWPYNTSYKVSENSSSGCRDIVICKSGRLRRRRKSDWFVSLHYRGRDKKINIKIVSLDGVTYKRRVMFEPGIDITNGFFKPRGSLIGSFRDLSNGHFISEVNLKCY